MTSVLMDAAHWQILILLSLLQTCETCEVKRNSSDIKANTVFQEQRYCVVNGGASVCKHFLRERWGSQLGGVGVEGPMLATQFLLL